MDEEEVHFVFFEVVGEIIWLWVHDVVRQAERMWDPVERGLSAVREVALFEGNFDLQDVGVGGEDIPRSMDLQEICFLVFGVLIKNTM